MSKEEKKRNVPTWQSEQDTQGAQNAAMVAAYIRSNPTATPQKAQEAVYAGTQAAMAKAAAPAVPATPTSVDTSPTWDQSTLKIGSTVYYDPDKNEFTGTKTSHAVSVYQDSQGRVSMQQTDSPLVFDAFRALSLQGSAGHDSIPDVGSLKTGDRVYYDIVSNKLTNTPSTSTVGMYYSDFSNSWDAYVKENGIVQGTKTANVKPVDIPDGFTADSVLADNAGVYAEGKQPLIATSAFIKSLHDAAIQKDAQQTAYQNLSTAVEKKSSFTKQSVLETSKRQFSLENLYKPFIKNEVLSYIGNVITGKDTFSFSKLADSGKKFATDVANSLGIFDPLGLFTSSSDTTTQYTFTGINDSGLTVPSGNLGVAAKEMARPGQVVVPKNVQAIQIKTTEPLLFSVLNVGFEWLQNGIVTASLRLAKSMQGQLTRSVAATKSYPGINRGTSPDLVNMLATFADNAPGVVNSETANDYLTDSAAHLNTLRDQFLAAKTDDADTHKKIIQQMTDIYRGQDYARTFLPISLDKQTERVQTLGYGFWGYPERYQQFLEAKADLELYKGTSLTHAEQISLMQNYVNPVVDLGTNLLLDPLNALDFVSAGKAFKAAGDAISATKFARPFIETLSGLAKLDEGTKTMLKTEGALSSAIRLAQSENKYSGLIREMAEHGKQYLSMMKNQCSPELLDRVEELGRVAKETGKADDIRAWNESMKEAMKAVENTSSSEEWAKILKNIEQDKVRLQNIELLGKDAVFNEINKVLFKGELKDTWLVAPFGNTLSLSDLYGRAVVNIMFAPYIGAYKGAIKPLFKGSAKLLTKIAEVSHLTKPFEYLRGYLRSSNVYVGKRVATTMHGFVDEAMYGITRSVDNVDFMQKVIDNASALYDRAVEYTRLAQTDEGTAAAFLQETDKKFSQEFGGYLGSSLNRMLETSKFFTKDEIVKTLQKAMDNVEAKAEKMWMKENPEANKFFATGIDLPIDQLRQRQALQSAMADYKNKYAISGLSYANEVRQAFKELYSSKTTVQAGKDTVDMGSYLALQKIQSPWLNMMTRTFYNVWDWMTSAWVDATLARRPQWLVFNVIESTFRGLFAYGNPFGFAPYYFVPLQTIMERLKAVGQLPVVFAQSYGGEGTTNLFTSDFMKKGLFRYLPSVAVDSAKKAYQKIWQSGMPLYVRIPGLAFVPIKSLSNLIGATQQMFETSLRARFFYAIFDTNLKQVYPKFVEKSVGDFVGAMKESGRSQEEITKYGKAFEQMLRLSKYDPALLKGLTDSSANVAGKFFGSLLASPELQSTPLADTFGENRVFLSGLLTEVSTLIDKFGADRLSKEPEILDGAMNYVKLRITQEAVLGQAVDLEDRIIKQFDLEGVSRLEELVAASDEKARSIQDILDRIISDLNLAEAGKVDEEASVVEAAEVESRMPELFDQVEELTGTRPLDLPHARQVLQNYLVTNSILGKADAEAFISGIDKMEKNEIEDLLKKSQIEEKDNPNWSAERLSTVALKKDVQAMSDQALAGTIDKDTSIRLQQASALRESVYGILKEYLRKFAPDAPLAGGIKSSSEAAWKLFYDRDSKLAIRLTNYNTSLRELVSSAMQGKVLKENQIPKLSLPEVLSLVGVEPAFDKEGKLVGFISYDYGIAKKSSPVETRRIMKLFHIPEDADIAIVGAARVGPNFTLKIGDKDITAITSDEALDTFVRGLADGLGKDTFPASIDDFGEVYKQFSEITDPIGQMKFLINTAKVPSAFEGRGGKAYVPSFPAYISMLVRVYNPGGSADKVEDVYKAVRNWQLITYGADMDTLRTLQIDHVEDAVARLIDKDFLGREFGGKPREEACALVGIWGSMSNVLSRYGVQDMDVMDTITGIYKTDSPMLSALGVTRTTVDDATKMLHQVILSFHGANVSTALHEYTHATLSVMDFASKAHPENVELASDLNSLRAWAVRTFRATNSEGVVPNATQLDEVIAKGFEAYVMRNYLPARSVQGIFAKLKKMLVGVYQTLRGYFGEMRLTEDVNKVYSKIAGDDIYQKAYYGTLKYKNINDIEQGIPTLLSSKLETFASLSPWEQKKVLTSLKKVSPFFTDKYTDALKDFGVALNSKDEAQAEIASKTLRSALKGVEGKIIATKKQLAAEEEASERGIKIEEIRARLEKLVKKYNQPDLSEPNLAPKSLLDSVLPMDDKVAADRQRIMGEASAVDTFTDAAGARVEALEEDEKNIKAMLDAFAEEAKQPAPVLSWQQRFRALFGYDPYENSLGRTQGVSFRGYGDHEWTETFDLPEQAITRAGEYEQFRRRDALRSELDCVKKWKKEVADRLDVWKREHSIAPAGTGRATHYASQDEIAQYEFEEYQKLFDNKVFTAEYQKALAGSPMSLRSCIQDVSRGEGRYVNLHLVETKAGSTVQSTKWDRQTIYAPAEWFDIKRQRGFYPTLSDVEDVTEYRTVNYKTEVPHGYADINGVRREVIYEKANMPMWRSFDVDTVYNWVERDPKYSGKPITERDILNWLDDNGGTEKKLIRQEYSDITSGYTAIHPTDLSHVATVVNPDNTEKIKLAVTYDDVGNLVIVERRPAGKFLRRGSWRALEVGEIGKYVPKTKYAENAEARLLYSDSFGLRVMDSNMANIIATSTKEEFKVELLKVMSTKDARFKKYLKLWDEAHASPKIEKKTADLQPEEPAPVRMTVQEPPTAGEAVATNEDSMIQRVVNRNRLTPTAKDDINKMLESELPVNQEFAGKVYDAYKAEVQRVLKQGKQKSFKDLDELREYLRKYNVSEAVFSGLNLDNLTGKVTVANIVQYLEDLPALDDPMDMLRWQKYGRDLEEAGSFKASDVTDYLTPAQQSKIRGTQALNKDGSVRVLWHATTGDFGPEDMKTYNLYDWGDHFAENLQAARDLADKKSKYDSRYQGKTFTFIPTVLIAKHPLELDTDPGTWYKLDQVLMDTGIPHLVDIGREMERAAYAGDWRGRDYVAKEWMKILESHGYDSIHYANEWEGGAAKERSWMIWNPAQQAIFLPEKKLDRVAYQQADLLKNSADEEADIIWSSWLHTARYGDVSLSDIARTFIEDGKYDPDNPDLVIAGLKAARDTLTERTGENDMKDLLDSVVQEAEYARKYTKSIIDGNPIAPPLDIVRVEGEELAGLRNQKLYNMVQLEKSLQGIDLISSLAHGAINTGAMKQVMDMPDDIKKILQDVGEKSSLASTEMLYKSVHGGAYMGQDLLDSVNETLRVMIDYSNVTKLDQKIKTFIPFWMYPSRSMPFWIQTMYKHPYILSIYLKYVRYSELEAKNRGYVNSKGEQLPSLVGYIPIPGTDIWFNPTAPLIYRYVYPEMTQQDQMEQDTSTDPFTNTLRWIINQAQNRGFNLGPVWSALFRGVIDDPYGRGNLGYEFGKVILPIPPELIPPWIDRATIGKLSKFLGQADTEEFTPQVKWKDLLVERQLLWDAMKQAQGVDSVYMKREIFAAAAAVLSDPNRDGNATWEAAKREYEGDMYSHRVLAFFTGFYTKSVDPQYAEMMQIRDQLNLLKKSINDDVLSKIFDLDVSAEDRRVRFNLIRYDDPLGSAYDMYQKMNYVTDPLTGKSIYGIDRRERIAEEYYNDEISEKYYAAIQTINEDRDKKMRLLSIPPSSEELNKIWDEWSAARVAIESQPMYAAAQRPWSLGTHTYEQIEQHYTDVFWSAINQTKPTWMKEQDESYEDYQKLLESWKAMMPVVASSVLPTVNAVLMNDIQNGLLDTQYNWKGLQQRLLESANPDSYQQWQYSRDSVFDALNTAWFDTYSKEYDPIYDLSGAKRELAVRQFEAAHPTPPDFETLWADVQKVYGTKFTRDQALAAYQGRVELDMEDYQSRDKPYAQEQNDIWYILNQASNSAGGMDKLRFNLASVGGNTDYITMWYDTGGDGTAWSDSADFLKFYANMKSAAEQCSFEPLSDADLVEKAKAEDDNVLFKEAAVQQFGDSITNLITIPAQMSYADKKKWQAANPELYAQIQAYYDLKDQFAADHQIWAKYYWDSAYQGGGATGASPAGASNLGSYVSGDSLYSRVKRRKGGGGKKKSSTYTTYSKTVLKSMAGRTTTNANSLLGKYR